MEFTLERPSLTKYPSEKLLEELRRVASVYGRHFSRREFDLAASYCKGSVVLDRFGTWQAALDAAGLTLERVRKDRSRISKEDLFHELGHVWRTLGHRPSKDEWERSKPKYSYTTYKSRFKGWVNACAAFIEHVSGAYPVSQSAIPEEGESAQRASSPAAAEDKRNVPMKLRYFVLARDNFKCVACGRSPATHAGVILHIDHIHPFSKDGKTLLENLRTLCAQCNWGKGKETV